MKRKISEAFDELLDIALFVFGLLCSALIVIVLATTAPIWIIPYTIWKNRKHDGGEK